MKGVKEEGYNYHTKVSNIRNAISNTFSPYRCKFYIKFTLFTIIKFVRGFKRILVDKVFNIKM